MNRIQSNIYHISQIASINNGMDSNKCWFWGQGLPGNRCSAQQLGDSRL